MIDLEVMEIMGSKMENRGLVYWWDERGYLLFDWGKGKVCSYGFYDDWY